MSIIETKEIEKTIYSYETTNKIYNKIYWGDDLNENYFAIDGENAKKNKKYYNIEGNLSDGVLYIFRWNLKKTKLIPYHVSMKKKTCENIMKGSKKFGTMSIIQELG